MYYHLEICDNLIRYETDEKRFNSNYHKILDQLTIMRYIVEKH